MTQPSQIQKTVYRKPNRLDLGLVARVEHRNDLFVESRGTSDLPESQERLAFSAIPLREPDLSLTDEIVPVGSDRPMWECQGSL